MDGIGVFGKKILSWKPGVKNCNKKMDRKRFSSRRLNSKSVDEKNGKVGEKILGRKTGVICSKSENRVKIL